MTWGHKVESCFSNFLVSGVGGLLPGVFSHDPFMIFDRKTWSFSFPGHKVTSWDALLKLYFCRCIHWSGLCTTWPWATCSLLETQIPLFSLFSKLTQCLGCIHEKAFPQILPKYPLPLYPTTVISIDSILPFFFFFLEWHLVCFQTFLVYSRNEAPGVIDPAIQSMDIFL